MIDFSRNHFELFGLPPRFRFDAATLDAAYRALQVEVHPDGAAGGTDADRRMALQSSARVNEAYQALRDPVRRAQYLLALHGVETVNERDTALPIAFLEAQLERREAASDAQAAGDVPVLESLLGEVRAEARVLEDDLAHRLDGEHAYAAARTRVRELTFLAKLADDIDAMLGALDA
jgi:molecular chaperone HscB